MGWLMGRDVPSWKRLPAVWDGHRGPRGCHISGSAPALPQGRWESLVQLQKAHSGGERKQLRRYVLLHNPEPRLQPPGFLGLQITQANSSNLACKQND